MLTYSAESPLVHPRRYCRDAIRDLVASVDTAQRLLRRTLVQRYRYSSLGLLWAFAPSLITALAMSLGQRAKIAGISGGAVPAGFYAVFGVLMLQTFLEALNAQRSIFTVNINQLSRSRIPIEGLILSGFLDNLISLGVKMPILAAVFWFFHIPVASTIVLGLVGFLLCLLFGTAVGLLLAPFNALKNDVENVMLFLPWILFATTPIFIVSRSKGLLGEIFRLNPLTKLFNYTRADSYSVGVVNGDDHLLYFTVSLVLAVVLVAAAWINCRIARPYIVERFLV